MFIIRRCLDVVMMMHNQDGKQLWSAALQNKESGRLRTSERTRAPIFPPIRLEPFIITSNSINPSLVWHERVFSLIWVLNRWSNLILRYISKIFCPFFTPLIFEIPAHETKSCWLLQRSIRSSLNSSPLRTGEGQGTPGEDFYLEIQNLDSELQEPT